MNFTLVKTSRIPASRRPVHLLPMARLLTLLGCEKKVVGVLDRNPKHFSRKSCNDFNVLWDKFDEAKRVYRNRIIRAHPDKNGSHDEAAALNAVWSVLKTRFAAKGVGIST